MNRSTSAAWPMRLFVCAGLALIAWEVAVEFLHETPVTTVQGEKPVAVDEFGAGALVSQTFLMPEAGLTAVDVRFSTDQPVTLLLRCELSRVDGLPSGAEIRIYEWSTTLKRVSGNEWRSITFPPIAASGRHEFAFRLQLVDVASAGDRTQKSANASVALHRYKVALAASADKAGGGGEFWIGDRRQTGSLSIRAFNGPRTAYQGFLVHVAPMLPAPLVEPVVLVVMLVYQWALLTLVYAVLIGTAERLTRSA